MYSLRSSNVANQVGAYPGFSGMERLGVFLLPSVWDTSASYRVIPTWVERGTVRAKCLALKAQHNVPGQGLNPDCSVRRLAH